MRWRLAVLAALPALLLTALATLGSQPSSCVPVEPVDPCGDIPLCDLRCPPGTHNPVDDNGCVHTCECVPDDECTPQECGPAPDCPVYECPDGSLGGCTDRCYRDASGACVWEVRACPAALQWYETCGDPVCRGWTPSDLPRCTWQTEGAACDQAGAECDLGNGCNTHLRCADRDPRLDGCPISRAAYKEDVHYLTPADRARLQDELLAFRLATYRYRGAPERGTQLGFLIEDQEPSAAIDSRRDMVDLYGYTSMVVATLQAQAEEIAALRRELAELRARVGQPAP